jgi:3-hydroxyisobutyrate dehydrogenase
MMAMDDGRVVERIGWIGAGVMGGQMCGHLISAGYDVSVFTRTRRSAERLLAAGATWRGSPADVAASSDVIITMVGYPEDVREVVLGQEGALASARPGSLLIDMTTSEPSLAVEICNAAGERGMGSLDAPVSGGDVGARDAKLVIMVGGAEAAFQRALPIMQHLGRLVVRQGGPGTGQHTKMVNQIIIASGMVGICEALLYGHKAGLDLGTVLDTIGGGAAGSWSLANYAPRILRGDYEPGFKVDHFVKDLGIALAEARRMRLALPGLALAEQLYIALSAQNCGQKGTQSLVLALAELSHAELWTATLPPGLDEGPSDADLAR